jgi:hypothetical protein
MSFYRGNRRKRYECELVDERGTGVKGVKQREKE